MVELGDLLLVVMDVMLVAVVQDIMVDLVVVMLLQEQMLEVEEEVQDIQVDLDHIPHQM